MRHSITRGLLWWQGGGLDPTVSVSAPIRSAAVLLSFDDLDPPLLTSARKRAHVLAALAMVATALVVHWRLPEFWFYSDDFVLLQASGERGLSGLLAEFFSFVTYWRPGQAILFDIVQALFGLSATAYCSVALGMHLCVTGLAYALVFSITRSAWIGALAGICLLLAPASLELVYFTAATTNCTLGWFCLFPAGWLAIRAIEGSGTRRARRAWIGTAVAFAASLTCREYAYHFPLFVFGASLALAPREPLRAVLRALLRAVPFGGTIVLHYVFLTAPTGTSATAGISSAWYLAQQFAMVTIGGTRGVEPWGWAIYPVGVALLAGLVVGTPRTRAVAWWALVASFPYVFRSYADRYAYPFLVMSIVAVACVLCRGGRILGIVGLALLATHLATRIGPALDREFARGETCRRALAWCESERLAESVDHIAVDVLPEPLLNGWPAMLDLFGPRRLEVSPLSLLPKPPFAILILGELPPADRTAFVRVDQSADYPSYRRVGRAGFVGDLVEVPMLDFVEDYVVEPDRDRARALATSGSIDLRSEVVVDRVPAVGGFAPNAPSHATEEHNRVSRYFPEPGRFRVELAIESSCVFVLSLPVDPIDEDLLALLDGEVIDLIRANGTFSAVFLTPGDHAFEIRKR